MKSSKALRQARKLIADGTEEYLCIALEFGVENGRYTRVYQRLNNFLDGMTVDNWLANNSKKYVKFRTKERMGREYDSAMHQYRLAWIDWMIPQYEAIGD